MNSYSSDEYDLDVNRPERLHPIVYVLIVNNYATLREIKEFYEIEDVLDLYEAYRVSIYNKSIATDAIKKRR